MRNTLVWLAAILAIAAGTPVQAQFDIGLYGLVNKVGVSGDAPINGSWSPNYTFGGGLNAVYGFGGDIAVTLGAQWEQRKTAMQFTKPVQGLAMRDTTVDSFYVNTGYISVPVGIRVFSGSKHFWFGTGAIIQILQSSSVDSAGVPTELKSVLRDVDVALYLSAAYQFHFDPFFPFIELRYQQGLLDLVGETTSNVLRSSPVVRMSGLQLLAGVAWRIP